MMATCRWDDEGLMTSMECQKPYSWIPSHTAGYQFDATRRMNTMAWDNGYGSSTFATAIYGTAGEMLMLSYGLGTETRTYNSLLQLIHQAVPWYMNMEYLYSSTNNNGRITGSVDSMAGETTSYTYDGVNRLSGASNSLWSAGYTYDGFGNLTSKSGSGGAPTMSASYNWQNRQSGISYDGNGNQTSAPNVNNAWDVENRLTKQVATTWPNSQSDYAYDPSGKRVLKRYDYDPWNTSPQFEIYFTALRGRKL